MLLTLPAVGVPEPPALLPPMPSGPVPALVSALGRAPSMPPLQPSERPRLNPKPRTKLAASDFMRIGEW